ncbi:MAG: SMC-Scp complex subunit ScpB, partial [Candidatus Sumerlaeia bacterium]|nr:SMC-Scp complex subunit ScpB [Candidatus Sumerlaeia bacterium]
MTENNNKQNVLPEQTTPKEASNTENKLTAFEEPVPVDIEVTLELEPTEKPADLPPISSLGQAKAILEALLFATTEPLSVSRLVKLTGLSQRTLRGLLLQLQLEYQRNSAGLQILEVAGGF